MTKFMDSFGNLAEVNTTAGLGYAVGHPIALTLLTQLSQDLLNVVTPYGSSSDLLTFDRAYRPFHSWIQEALYRALRSGGAQYLVLDYGDDVDNWVNDPVATIPTPHEIYSQVPTVNLVKQQYRLPDEQPIAKARYIKIANPYPFLLGATLDKELGLHDRISAGISDLITAPGLLMFGVKGLWGKLMAGAQAVANLTTRLQQTKRAAINGGILAYSIGDEEPELHSKAYSKEHESLRMIENRVCAITGVPSFVIWGHTDGDGFGVKTSLDLYSQRLGSMASRYLVPALDQLAQVLAPTDETPPLFRVIDLYPEDKAAQVSRFEGEVSGLVALVSIGSITAIEARDTVASKFDLVLSPTPTIQTGNPGIG